MTIGRTPSVNRTTSGRTRQPKGAAVESIDDYLAALSPEKSATLRQVRDAVRTVASESPMPSSGRRWSSGSATCFSTTWLGRCGAFLSSSSTGTAIIRSNPSTSKTLRSRRWRLAIRAGTPSPTPPTGLVGLLMRDVVLTGDEVDGLVAGLLTSAEPPTGTTRLTDWLGDNADGLRRRYLSELWRNYRM